MDRMQVKAIHGHLPHAGVRRERRDRFAISFGILDIRREEILATCNRENSAGTRHGSQVHFDHESGAPSVALRGESGAVVVSEPADAHCTESRPSGQRRTGFYGTQTLTMSLSWNFVLSTIVWCGVLGGI